MNDPLDGALAARERRARAKLRQASKWDAQGERADGYRVAVTAPGHRGRRKFATFAWSEENSQWQLVTETIRDQLHPNATREETLSIGAPLPTSMDLARGVSVSALVLTTILDALVTDNLHEIDLADLTLIVSQCGSYIRRLGGLPPAERQPAEQALYMEILARCTTI
ncbi:hypothetical protein JN086_14155 [Mycolicibacterium austroafricanum]|uniref:Uncharacterized protein n=1 Tax=Mycolicibacterium austroafricanum TaxID=39687 RepID=A0ABT8HHT3_MYCAO|nr:hypothetical protein [Mycolicibacterium austroafricanum]MDN4520316.1 hypothetical protein [Mycolicibacterium austroafricanum]QRZ09248.1 hypothetical protein JN090_12530 [Mycolicibacterium austroafricanum]QZT71020.1 hypothetical protein JN086_14155 [Mycolicibacterium austroafricanum]